MNAGSSAMAWVAPLLAYGRAYVGIASNCDNPSVRGEARALDMQGGSQLANQYFVPSGEIGAGIWNSPALSSDGNTLVLVTGEDRNGYEGAYVRSMVTLDPLTLAIRQWHQQGTAGVDDDFGTTPIIFHDATGRVLGGANHKDGNFHKYPLHNLAAGPVW